ncbi:MFS transporter [Marinivivus vitaminiproducens]|uniref:MFS transporter n=1 Tax=Marinivivus vitaminiproducens TaxID=3035935 RepID=UPI0027A00C71|nr:MFS transporter [Geminicoccaceae bacterium SCSIO 64248]
MPLSTTLNPLTALLAGAFIVLVGQGLQGMIVPVRAQLESFATSEIGLLSSAYSAGFVLSCILTPYVMRRVGHIRTFAVMAALAACVVQLLMLAVHPWVWITLRVVTGFCFAGLFMVIESWLNAQAGNDNRGQVFSVYMLVNLIAVMLGQMLLPLGDPAAVTLFATTAILITLALVPVSMTRTQAPMPLTEVRLRLGRLYELSPVGVMGCFIIGMGNGAIGGLGAIYAQRLGFSLGEVALFMSAGILGGAVGQMPLGRLSDRMDRRRVIAAAAVAAAGLGLALAIAGGLHGAQAAPELPIAVVIGLYFLLGGFIYSIYGLCVAHANDFASTDEFVETSSGLLLTYGVGNVVGPVFASLLMDRIGTGALFAWSSVVQAFFAVFVIYRMTRRAAPERTTFVVSGGVSERSGPALAVLDPRSGDQSASDEPEADAPPPDTPADDGSATRM